MTLRPKSFELDIAYNCPKCGDEHWYAKNELRSRPILMCCDEVFEIEPIHEVSIHFKFNSNIPDKAIEVLKELGFTLEEMNSSGIQANTVEEYVRKFLASRQNESETNQT